MAKGKRTKANKISHSKRVVDMPQDAFSQAVLAWYAPEYLKFKRGRLWFLIAALIDLGLIAFALFSGSWTMALVFIVLPLVVLLEHRKKPKIVDVIISPYGIKFGILKMPFSNIRCFWILHEPPYVDELHILTDSKLHPEITIPLMGADPILLRQYLVTQVPEWEGKKQSFLDNLVKILKLS